MPKSRIFSTPSPSSMMFEGLMSRWMMPAPCACARPAHSSSNERQSLGDRD